MAPPGKSTKQTKQTSLDSYSRPPSTRLAKKGTEVRGSGAAPTDSLSVPKLGTGIGADNMAPTKEKGKSKVAGARGTPRAPESVYSEDLESNMSWSVQSETEAARSDAGQGPKRVIQNAEDGRCYLEEEALTDPGKRVDLDAMAGSLVQISLLEGIPAPVHLAVCSVALILAQCYDSFHARS